MYRNKLLVVGAGPVGLAMADSLKQAGIAYDQVDASTGLGGNWRHGVYSTVHIISSKRSTAYADYPMPDGYPDFPSGKQMLAYLESYARDRGLMEHMEFNLKVVEATPNLDDTWRVRFSTGEERVYKGVAICNGHHWAKHGTDIPGSYTGQVMHSKDYQKPADIAGKRVLVVGCGNSGCDLASEAARVGVSSDWSIRGGAWFLPKTAFGRPLTDLPIWRLPIWSQRLILKALIRMFIGKYSDYGLPMPKHKIFERHPTFGTDPLNYIRQGRITPRPQIKTTEGKTVHFADGSSGDYDLIVMATGFDLVFPFLPEGLVEVHNNTAQIYGGAFPPGVKNLYIVGSEQPRNGFGTRVTPATRIYARMIKMQDELEHPLGSVLKFAREKIPPSPFLDPGSVLRQIWLGGKLLWMLRFEGKRLAKRETYRPAALELSERMDYQSQAAE
ncbi:MAG: flavin-containing monooxygenase [Hyphomicrobiaceae bacterium]